MTRASIEPSPARTAGSRAPPHRGLPRGEAHHYSGSYPAARFRFGLYRGAKLVGAAVFSHPVNDKALAVFPGEPFESVELGRLVLLDEVPANGESWFVARCFEALRHYGLMGVLSMSDPVQRATAEGALVFPRHVEGVYQALNALYLGATKRTLHLLPDGTVFSARAAQKVRAQERGWKYAVAQLVAAGAPKPKDNVRAWLAEWLPRVTRPLRHPGNFRYAWTLRRRDRKHLRLPQGVSLEQLPPYPKLLALPPDATLGTTHGDGLRGEDDHGLERG